MNAKQIKERVSIVDFLSKMGFEPTRRTNYEFFYHSPIRDGDRTASFAVNDEKGVWYDWGSGDHGNIVDLALHLKDVRDVESALKIINDIYQGQTSFSFRKQASSSDASKKKQEDILLKVSSIGYNKAISGYIESRGVLDVALSLNVLKEVYFEREMKDGVKRRFFGVGWENESGGFDVRLPHQKTCLQAKDITVFNKKQKSINVFEGMFDFLSMVKLDPSIIHETSVILNTLSFSNMVADKIAASDYKNVHLYFDNDKRGKIKTAEFIERVKIAKDLSGFYSGHSDVNDYLKSKLSASDNRISSDAEKKRESIKW